MENATTTFNIVSLSDSMTRHAHNYHQMVVGLTGQSEFDIQGVRKGVLAGTGCVVSANVEHSFYGDHDNQVLVVNTPLRCSDNSMALFAESSRTGYFNLDLRTQQLISLLTAEAQQSITDIGLCNSISQTIFYLLKRSLISPTQERPTPRLDITLIDSYIQQHLDKKISVAELASLSFLAQSQFYLLFKEQVGITPHQYVLRKRLEFAKQLILVQRMPLSQVAQLCGFSSQSSFSQAFRRLYGQPPARYQLLI